MHAVITAGSKPDTGDPLYEATRGRYKALIEIAGKPMIQWVLDALSGSRLIEGVVIIGLPPFTNLTCSHPMLILEDQGGLLENNRAGVREVLKADPSAESALLLTSDIPAITTEMVDWVASQIQGCACDFVYPVIERRVMESRFPGSRRTFIKLKDHEVCGGDVMAVSTAMLTRESPLWQKLIQSRKNPVQQASILGFDTLFLILLRQLNLQEAGRSVGKRLGIEARAVLCPYAEIGMDVDKPNQLHLMETELARLHAA
jgi:hypothetical protein